VDTRIFHRAEDLVGPPPEQKRAGIPVYRLLVLLYIIAFWAVVSGVLEVVAAVRLRRAITSERGLIIGGVLSVLFGIVLIVSPGTGSAVSPGNTKVTTSASTPTTASNPMNSRCSDSPRTATTMARIPSTSACAERVRNGDLPNQLVVAPSSSAWSTRPSQACHSSPLHPRRSVNSTYASIELTTRRMSRARSRDRPTRRAPS